MLIFVLVVSLLLWLGTVWRVYRGGTTLNDHLVALVVSGCIAIYPLLSLGVWRSGLVSPLPELLCLGFLLGAASIYGLFHVLDGRRDPGPWIGLGYISQPAYSFSLWTGLLLVFWMPLSWLLGGAEAQPLWPGPWLILPLVPTVWGTVWTYWVDGRVREYGLPAPGLAHELVLVQLSDIHASPVMTRRHLDRMVDRVNRIGPDLVLATGDFLMPFSEDEHEFLIEALTRIEAPVLGCPGNHDLPVLERLGQELEAAGIGWLVDQAQVLRLGTASEGVEVVGVNFHWRAARAALTGALDALSPAPGVGYRILLAHDPRLFAWIPLDRFDLMLSGHTHGGQVGTNMFGLPWSILRPLGVFDQGFFRRGSTLLYVHRGNWHTGLPPRMGIASEIAVFRLGSHAAPQAREVDGSAGAAPSNGSRSMATD